MAASTALSASLTVLAEHIAAGLDDKRRMPAPGYLYGIIIRARDEAVCLEARAGARDVAVRQLLEEVTKVCAEAARFEALLNGTASARIQPQSEGTQQ